MPYIVHTTASLDDGEYELDSVPITETLVVKSVSTDVPARVRIYPNSETSDQTADADRSLWANPSPSNSILLDLVTGLSTLELDLVNAIILPVPSFLITVTNLSGPDAPGAVQTTLGSVSNFQLKHQDQWIEIDHYWYDGVDWNLIQSIEKT